MQIFSEVGKGLKKFFSSPKTPKQPAEVETAKVTTTEKIEQVPPIPHDSSFGAVYANDLARAEIEKGSPKFPVGSILVRERNATPTSETPEALVVMVKREKDFSPDTNDWEFFTINGGDLALKSRETKGRCIECHARADKTDFVFKTYLK